jgi:Peroxiredoxin
MPRPWLLLAALLLPLCASAAGKQTLTPVPGLPPAPDFTLQDVDGKTWRLSELRGRPVIVNFWATWCPPAARRCPPCSAPGNSCRPKA